MGKSSKRKILFWMVICFFAGILFLVLVAPSFLRVSNLSPSNACINNLRRIEAAKDQWALEHDAKTNAVVTMNQLTNYLGLAAIPKCPSGGTYKIGKVGETPTCSIPGHDLQ